MEEEEALRNYCRRKISVLNKQQQLESSKEKEEERGTRKHKGRRREKTESTGQVLAGGGIRDHGECHRPLSGGPTRGRNQTSLNLMFQGPKVQPALQLITMLRLKTFEEMRRVRRHFSDSLIPCWKKKKKRKSLMCLCTVSGRRGGAP